MSRLLQAGLCVWLMLQVACSAPAKSKPVLSKTKMEAVMWDVIRADVYTYDHIRKDSALDDTLLDAGLQLRVFQKHRVTREQYYSSYQYYIEHPDDLKEILDSIASRKSKGDQTIQKVNL